MVQAGSSPRMRGKRHFATLIRFRRGLIPAHAGKTSLACGVGHVRWAHPRACGENPNYLPCPSPPPGSSPRMRGKRKISSSPSIISGLIPAHAGKTKRGTACANLPPAHPRACGENVATVFPGFAGGGSSPRMRGKRCERFPEHGNRGLIPAHAGKTVLVFASLLVCGAHPRACGENSSLWIN